MNITAIFNDTSVENLFENKNRPTVVTILGWYFIVSAIFSIYGLLTFLSPETANSLQHIGANIPGMIMFNLVSGIVMFSLGYFLLNKQAWIRTFFLAYYPLSFAASFLVMDIQLPFILFSIIIYMLFAYLLFLPTTTAFFAGTYTDSELQIRMKSVRSAQKRKSVIAKIFAVISAFFAAMFLLIMIVFLFMSQVTSPPIVIIVISIPTILLFTLSIVLWGWMRWQAVLGWTIAGFGGAMVSSAIFMLLMQNSPALTDPMFADMDYSIYPIVGLVGLLPLGIGASLVYLQHKKDVSAAEELELSEPAAISGEMKI
ncbi:MAG: hypothetical protein LAT52_12740 [Balneolales bacterium]|nr:hypothetical protein [Balneolales bacterium]